MSFFISAPKIAPRARKVEGNGNQTGFRYVSFEELNKGLVVACKAEFCRSEFSLQFQRAHKNKEMLRNKKKSNK